MADDKPRTLTEQSRDGLWLVDGSNFLFRAYHALPPLSTKAGVPSGAVFGFTQMLIRIEAEHRPKHLAIIFDAGARSFRNDLYPEYKAHRPPAPEDLIPQFSLVREVVEAFGLPVLEAKNLEADDLIATLARRAKEAGQRVVILSSDKDLMQLVDDRCVLLDTMKNVTYDARAVQEKFGVPPSQLGDLLALMGDSVDNVPGVPGVGPKTAAALVQAFGGTESLLARLDEVAGLKGLRGAASVAEKLKANIEPLRLSRRLVTLDEHAPMDIELSSLLRSPADPARIAQKLRELEFTRLAERFGPAAVTAIEAPVASATPRRATSTVVGTLGQKPVQIITDEVELYALAGEISRTRALGVSLLTSTGSSLTASPIGIAFAFPYRPPAYVPLGHRYLSAPVQHLGALPHLRDALRTPGSTRYVHDSKEVELVLARFGAAIGEHAWDPGLASYLLDPAQDHTLPGVATQVLADLLAAAGLTVLPDREVLTGSGRKAVPLESVDIERAAAHAALEAEASLVAGQRLRDRIVAAPGQEKLLDELERPLGLVLAAIEPHGIRLDSAALARMSADAATELARLEKEVEVLAGQPINLGSPKQLQELLFGKLQLPPVRKTKTGLSTDADVLEELAPLHPVAQKILDHRVIAKLKGTYLDALPLLVDPKTGRLHTSYKQTIAATGRLSSVEPNLQNVPIRTELGREIRRAFIADPGNVLVVADYSQIELRILAHLSGDEVLTDAFKKGEDVHERTVVEMFGEAKRSDKDMRRVAKMINYGIVYGLSEFGLAARLGIEREASRRYIEGYNRTYSGVATYMEAVIEEARKHGGARTLLNRFRPLPELESKNQGIRRYGERMARNTPIQGTAADLLKLAMIDVERLLEKRGGTTRMLLTVHDELVLEAPKAEADEVAGVLRGAMEGVMKLDVPLVVDVGIGDSWADAK